MEFIQTNLVWLLAAVLVAGGLLLGVKDLLRFSPYRVRAVAGVCFRESLRRKVLLVIPLAVLGVFAVTAFQKPIDEQDAIRQTIKFCLFATGLIVVMTGIILACTNLPREIDNRVIYTIVTKPTTRLEIVLGKVVGFAALSALVLVIMGAFTFGYLHFLSWRYQGAIQARLADPATPTYEKASLEHYRDFGLLTAKKLETARTVDVLATLPVPGSKYRWFRDALEGDAIVPFKVDPSVIGFVLTKEEGDATQPKLTVVANLAVRESTRKKAQADATSKPTPLLENTDLGPTQVGISILNQYGELILDGSQIGQRSVALVPPPLGTPEVEPGVKEHQAVLAIPRQYLQLIAQQPRIYVQLTGLTPGKELGLGVEPAKVILTDAQGRPQADQTGRLIEFESEKDLAEAGRQRSIVRGRQGRGGQQVRGGSAEEPGAVALYKFRDAGYANQREATGLELHVSIERSGDETYDRDVRTRVEVEFYNLAGPDAPRPTKPTATVTGFPENNRTLFLTVPPEAVNGGNFDVAVRVLTPEHYITASLQDVTMVAQRQPFAWNLLLSLLVLWMMSLLVVVVAVFTSTFLSWPIAVVLTLVILTVRWIVELLADTLTSGIGNQVATNMGLRDSAAATTVSRTVEALTSGVKTVASVLPDLSVFRAVEDIERGLRVPVTVLAESGVVLLLFGLPLLVLSYVVFRYKEVAP